MYPWDSPCAAKGGMLRHCVVDKLDGHIRQCQLCGMFWTVDRAHRGLSAADETAEKTAASPVQNHIDAVIDDLVKGMTSRPQEDALGKALVDRKLQRSVGRRAS
jgi:hypothetical protein